MRNNCGALLTACVVLAGGGASAAEPKMADEKPGQMQLEKIDKTYFRYWQKKDFVSLIALIANPKRYRHKYVCVEGFLHYAYEDHHLFVTKEDADHLIEGNSINIDICDKPTMYGSNDQRPAEVKYFDQKYVQVEGSFDIDTRRVFPNGIVKVEILRELPGLENGK